MAIRTIIIMGDITDDIVGYLEDSRASSISIVNHYKTLSEACDEMIKVPINIDKLVFSDHSLQGTNSSGVNLSMVGLTKLLELIKSPFFICKSIIHLAITNSHTIEESKFIFYNNDNPVVSFHGNPLDFNIYVNFSYTKKDIANYILGYTNNQFSEPITYATKYREKLKGKNDTELTINHNSHKTNQIVSVPDPDDYINFTNRIARRNDLMESLKHTPLSPTVSLPPLANLNTEITKVNSFAHSDYSIHSKSNNNEVNGKIYSIIGDHRSGASSLAYILADSASKGELKTLVIDLDYNSIGLSYIIGSLNNQMQVYILDDLLADFNNYLHFMISKENTLNGLVMTLKSKANFTKEEFSVIICTLINRFVDIYKVIILDIHLDDYTLFEDLIKMSCEVVFTIPKFLPSIVTFGYKLSKINLLVLSNKPALIVPTLILNHIKGAYKPTANDINEIMHKIVPTLRYKLIATLKITSYSTNSIIFQEFQEYSKLGDAINNNEQIN